MPFHDSTYEQTWREARADKPFVLEDVNQHTPGPWDCDSESMDILFVSEPHGCGWIAMVSGSDSEGRILPPGVRAANARLIAAAPCLLSALERLMSEVGDGFNCDPSDATLSQCWSAIRKARRGGE